MEESNPPSMTRLIIAQLEKDEGNDIGSYVSIQLNKIPFLALVDSGNLWRNAVSESVAKKLGFKREQLRPLEVTRIATAKPNASLRVLGELPHDVTLLLGTHQTPIRTKPIVIEGLSMDVNLSGPFLQNQKIDLLNTRRCLRWKGKEVGLRTAQGILLVGSVEKEEEEGGANYSHVYVGKKVRIPPYSWGEFPVRISAIQEGKMNASMGKLQGSDAFMERTSLHPYRRQTLQPLPTGWAAAAALNTTDEEVTIQEGTQYGVFALMPTKEKEEEVDSTHWTDARKEKWLTEEFRLDENCMLKEASRKKALLDILLKHWDVFSTDGSYGRTTLVQHDILTEKVPPVRMRFRPINPQLEEGLKQQVEDWMKHDVVEPSNSPWSFALVAVKKKNGKIRWCVDYRKLNAITKKDAHPLPYIEDNLARLSNSRIFSALDGMGAFHVVELTEDTKPKTAFSTPWGSYQFKRMPFGLSNGPATYSRLMQLALQGIPTTMCLPYLDDVIVHSHTFAQHLTNLDYVLAAHVHAGLKLQPSKCHLFQEETQYLGHLVSEKGIRPVPEYIQVVKEWPLPTNRTEVRAFLGKISYYRRFIPNFAAKARDWTEAIKEDEGDEEKEKSGRVSKTAPITVTDAMKKSFEELKEVLTKAPILAYPRFGEQDQFILDTDWSQENGTIGAVLSQVQDGEERVICYGAKKLAKSQRNYPPTKGELFAILYFCKLWRYYLQFRKFLLRTDHRALTWIRTMEHPTGMVLRWLETLADFNFEVEHREGVKHGNADALSRVPHAPQIEEEEVIEGDTDGGEQAVAVSHLQLAAMLNPFRTVPSPSPLLCFLHQLREEARLPTSVDGWVREQEFDVDLRQVRDFVRQDQWPEESEVKRFSQILRHYYDVKEALWVDEEGLLRYADSSHPSTVQNGVICIPWELQDELIITTHKLIGHKGIEATLSQVLQQGHFPGVRRRVRDIVMHCVPCQEKTGLDKDQRAIYCNTGSGYPFQKLSIDFVGPLPPSKRNNLWLLTVRDAFTKWVEAFPIKQATAVKVAEILENEIFVRYGYPESIHSDQGTQFTSELMKQVAKLHDIVLTHTPAYNPKSNLVERAHRDMKACLRAMHIEEGLDWEENLPHLLFAMRTTECRMTGYTPFQLMFGRDPIVPLLTLAQLPHRKEEEQSLSDYVRKHREKSYHYQNFAREHLTGVIHRQQKYYRKSLHDFGQGDLVWLYTPPTGAGVNRKFHRGWTGPWTVLNRPTHTTYQIRGTTASGKDKEVVVSCDRIKQYYTPKERTERFLPEEKEEENSRGNEALEEIDFSLPLPPVRRKATGALLDEIDSEDEMRMPRGPWRERLRQRRNGRPAGAEERARSFLPRPLPRVPPAIRPPRSSLWRKPAPEVREENLQIPVPPATTPHTPKSVRGWQQLLSEHRAEPGIQQEAMPPTVENPIFSDDEGEEDAREMGARLGARPKRPPLALRRLQDSAGWAEAPQHQD